VDNGIGQLQNMLVLGCTSGIGCAVADALPPDSRSVTLAGRHPSGLGAAGAWISRPGRDIATLHYDSSLPASDRRRPRRRRGTLG
jgi:NADP-dependent 3-hydroxy acid dehydrogenase YdfG